MGGMIQEAAGGRRSLGEVRQSGQEKCPALQGVTGPREEGAKANRGANENAWLEAKESLNTKRVQVNEMHISLQQINSF